MRIQLFIFGLISLASSIIGQGTFGINDFLSGAKEEESVIFQRGKISYLAKLPYRLPRIEKLEFRTETNDFDLRKQEYLLRVSPNSFKNVKTHRLYHQTVQYMTQMEMEETLGRALTGRYDLLVDYIFLQEILSIKEKLSVIYSDKTTLLNRSITLPGFEVLDLFNAQDENQANVRDVLDLKNEIVTTRQTIERFMETDGIIAIDRTSLISVDGVKKSIFKIAPLATATHPLLKVQSAKLYNNMLEYEWESAKSKFSIDYFQVKYGYDPNDNFRELFSIGIGFEIPLKGGATLELNELLIDKLESESRYKEVKTQLENEKFSLYQELQNRIQKYELVEEQLEDGQAEFALQEYSKIAEASPLAILKLRESTLNNELLLKKLELEIMQSYIAYLNLLGLLNERPLRNYLSKELSLF